MNSDLAFITNEKGQNLKERFEVLIKDTKLFDYLVGYFYASSFHVIYKSLGNFCPLVSDLALGLYLIIVL
ncbi:MAG: hypothetical protein AAB514_03315 [Patescibacteria group bacterium]